MCYKLHKCKCVNWACFLNFNWNFKNNGLTVCFNTCGKCENEN